MTEVHNDRKSIRIIGVYPEMTGLGTETQRQRPNIKTGEQYKAEATNASIF